jgi:hypothetical protein
MSDEKNGMEFWLLMGLFFCTLVLAWIAFEWIMGI